MPSHHFDATVEDINGWLLVRLAKSASAALPSRGQVMVQGTFANTAIHLPAEPDGNGGHWIAIDKQLQKTTGVKAGDKVDVAVASSKVWPEPVIPPDIKKGIVTNPLVSSQWKRITPLARWEWLRWINSTANADTRKKRIDVSVSKLSHGERRPCCFNRSMCCIPQVSKSGVLLGTL